MDAATVEALVKAHLPECQVTIAGEGNKYDILVVGDVFAGLRPVQKQQLVYAALAEQIASGAIHAVNIRALTPAQQPSV